MKRTWKGLAALTLACMLAFSLPATLVYADDDLPAAPSVSEADPESPPAADPAPEDQGGTDSEPVVPGGTDETGSDPGYIGPELDPPSEQPSLTVMPAGTEMMADDPDLKNVTVDLYKVASAEFNDDNTASYVMVGDFAQLYDYVTALTNGDEDQLLDVSRRVANIALSGKMDQRMKPTYEHVPTGDYYGSQPVEAGLYLVVAHRDFYGDFNAPRPDGLEVGDDVVTKYSLEGTDKNGKAIYTPYLATDVRTENYRYFYQPILVFVPGKQVEDGEKNGANNGITHEEGNDDWWYNVLMTLKPVRERVDLGKLMITKTLADQAYNENEEPQSGCFIFHIDTYVDGELDRSLCRQFELVFDGVGSQTYVLENIPAGAEVVVTEVDSGASYTLKADEDASRKVTITAHDVTGVEFTNVASHGDGGAIINRFDYDSSQGGWLYQEDRTRPVFNT